MKYIIKRSKVLNKIIFYLGQVFFKIFGKTPNIAYMAMVNLYCLTNGRFLEKKGRKKNFLTFLNIKANYLKRLLQKMYMKLQKKLIKKDIKFLNTN